MEATMPTTNPIENSSTQQPVKRTLLAESEQRIKEELGDFYTPRVVERPHEQGVSLVDRVRQMMQSRRRSETPAENTNGTVENTAQGSQLAALDATLESNETRVPNRGLVGRLIQALRTPGKKKNELQPSDPNYLPQGTGIETNQITGYQSNNEAGTRLFELPDVAVEAPQRPQSRFVQGLLAAQAQGIAEAQANRPQQPDLDPRRFIPQGRHLNQNFVEMTSAEYVNSDRLLRVEGPAGQPVPNVGEILEENRETGEPTPEPQVTLRRDAVQPREINNQENPSPLVGFNKEQVEEIQNGETVESVREFERLEQSDEFKQKFPKLFGADGKLLAGAKDIIDVIIHPESKRNERGANGSQVEVFVLSPRQKKFIIDAFQDRGDDARAAEFHGMELTSWLNNNPMSVEEPSQAAETSQDEEVAATSPEDEERQRTRGIYPAHEKANVETKAEKEVKEVAKAVEQVTFNLSKKIQELEDIRRFREEYPELFDTKGAKGMNERGRRLIVTFMAPDNFVDGKIDTDFRTKTMNKLSEMRGGINEAEQRKIDRLMQWIERDTTRREGKKRNGSQNGSSRTATPVTTKQPSTPEVSSNVLSDDQVEKILSEATVDETDNVLTEDQVNRILAEASIPANSEPEPVRYDTQIGIVKNYNGDKSNNREVVVKDPNGVGGEIRITNSVINGKVDTGVVTTSETRNVPQKLSPIELADLGLNPDGTPMETLVVDGTENVEIDGEQLGDVVSGVYKVNGEDRSRRRERDADKRRQAGENGDDDGRSGRRQRRR